MILTLKNGDINEDEEFVFNSDEGEILRLEF